MTKRNMALRIEPKLKAQATSLFESIGMDLNTATEIFYRQALLRRGLPFDVKLREPNEVTYAAIATAEKDEEIFGLFNSVTDLMESLNA